MLIGERPVAATKTQRHGEWESRTGVGVTKAHMDGNWESRAVSGPSARSHTGIYATLASPPVRVYTWGEQAPLVGGQRPQDGLAALAS